MSGLNHAITGLDQALDAPRRHQMWRWLVRHRVNTVHDALARENSRAADAWLASRQSTLTRERETLLMRLELLSSQLVGAHDAESVRVELKRLVTELHRHGQRLNDLVYDGVALELGGSE